MAPQPAEAASRTAPLLCRRRQAQRSSASSTASTSGSGSGSGAVRTAGSTAARLPLSAVLLLAAAAPRAARAQAPTGVTLTRSDANTSVTVSWGYAGSDTTDFIVKAEPYVFQDSFNGGIKPGWVWDAPCNPSNTASGTCTYSTSVYQGLVAIGVSAGVGFGYASGRGSSELIVHAVSGSMPPQLPFCLRRAHVILVVACCLPCSPTRPRSARAAATGGV